MTELKEKYATRYRSRSRSSGFSSNFSLMILIPAKYVQRLTRPLLLNKIKDDSQIEKICTYLPDGASQDKIIGIHSSELYRQLSAFSLILHEFMNHNHDILEDGIKILVPESMVSLIIGKNGKQIQKIREDSHSTILVLDKNSATSDRQVQISGHHQDIERGVMEICKLIKDRANNTQLKSPMPPTRSQVRFVISSRCAGIIIGKGGQFTKKLKTESDVDIRLIKTDRKPLKENEHTVIVSGKKENCAEVIPKIVRKIEESLENGRVSDTSTKMLIPSSSLHYLTTSKSPITQDLALLSRGAKIHISNKTQLERENDDILVIIEGSLLIKQEAALKIFKRIEMPYEQDSQHYINEINNRPSISITVPEFMVGKLIGRGGEKVNTMMELSGSSITFHSAYEGAKMPNGDNARLCTLRGTTTEISSAIKIILERINNIDE